MERIRTRRQKQNILIQLSSMQSAAYQGRSNTALEGLAIRKLGGAYGFLALSQTASRAR
jgi:hypothetical protein